MAVTQQSRSGVSTLWYKIQHGSVEQYLGDTFPENVDKERVRENVAGNKSANPGKKSYYLTENVISGEIVRIEANDNNYNSKDLSLTMRDGEETYVVTTNYFNSYAENLLNRICSIDSSKPNQFHLFAMTIQATTKEGVKMIKDDGSPLMNSYSVLRQGANDKINTLKTFFKYEELPKPVKVPVKGATITDNTDRMNTLFAHACESLKKNLGLSNAPYSSDSTKNESQPSAAQSTPAASAFSTQGVPAVDQDDDLPF